MALITRKELEEAIDLLDVEGIGREEAKNIIVAVLTAVDPTKLLQEYETKRVYEHCMNGRRLDDLFDFHTKEAAIELQFPGLWQLHNKMESAKEAMKALAEFLATPVNKDDL